MRAVFIGAGPLTVSAARLLLKRGHEVVIVDRDKAVIDSFTGDLDCGFIHGDGSKPAILEEADPAHSDVLLCLTGSDQTNILASLVGRSLGFSRVVTEISDPELEHVCVELELEDTIVPSRTIGRYLADVCEGRNPLEMSVMLRDDARLHSFVLSEDPACSLAELKLPENSRVVCLYRDDRLLIPLEDTQLEADDEVVVVTDYESLDALKAMVQPGDG
jgi:trk system potassium uptake protein TrkA